MTAHSRVLAVLIVFFLWVAPGVSATPHAAPTAATPAFWVVEGNGATLYLLGSVHLLPPEMKWSTPAIDAARAQAEVFVFEAPLKDADNAMASFVDKYGHLAVGKTLKDLLSAKEYEDLETASWSVQYPPKLLANVRPWLAAVFLELYSYLKIGYSSHYGVDHVIERAASAQGKTLAYFETVDQQLAYFLKLSPRDELAFLKSTVRDILEKPDAPVELVDAWALGDTEKLSQLIETGMASVPQLKAQLLVARNREWVPQILTMLRSGRVHFVTVGAGHLVGKESVVRLLRAKGVKVTGP